MSVTNTNPTGISAGKPTANIFKLGDALDITPRETLIISKATNTGRTRVTAPINI